MEGPGLSVNPVQAELCPSGSAPLQTHRLLLFVQGNPDGRKKRPADGCGPDPNLVNN